MEATLCIPLREVHVAQIFSNTNGETTSDPNFPFKSQLERPMTGTNVIRQVVPPY